MFYTDFSPSPSVVNDGGVSWLRKSYQRMKEQADREQRSVESVVAERYGVSKHTVINKHTSLFNHTHCKVDEELIQAIHS